MVVAPSSKGGMIENRWQPMSEAMWCLPSSCSTSLVAAKIGRSGQPMQKPGGRPGTTPTRSGMSWPLPVLLGALHLARQHVRGLGAQEFADAVEHDLAGIFAGHRQMLLADDPRAAAGLVQHRGKGLLDVVGLALLDDEDRVLALAEGQELVVDQRVDGVEHVERHFGLAISVGEPDALQRADHGIVHAALHDDADRAVRRAEELVDLARCG